MSNAARPGEDLRGNLTADETLLHSSAPAAETLWKERFAQRTQRVDDLV